MTMARNNTVNSIGWSQHGMMHQSMIDSADLLNSNSVPQDQ
jgi:hypothetical protein